MMRRMLAWGASTQRCSMLSMRRYGSEAVAYDTLSGTLLSYELVGPRDRADGTKFWMQRYSVETAGGEVEKCTRFVDDGQQQTEPEVPSGSDVSFRVKRRGPYVDVVSVSGDVHDNEPTTLSGKVTDITREGPKVSAKGNEWWMDVYTLSTPEGERQLRYPVFTSTSDGHLCEVGDEIKCKVERRGEGWELQQLVLPETEEIEGVLLDVSRLGPRFGPSGREYTLEFYNVRTKPTVVRRLSRFVDQDEPPLADAGAEVSVLVHNNESFGRRGFSNVLRMDTRGTDSVQKE
eukprot:Hpha_TRINITY_DN15704_c0_g1::TRINITY_DN15704_c0_g1_i5::g.39362::m.39362